MAWVVSWSDHFDIVLYRYPTAEASAWVHGVGQKHRLGSEVLVHLS